MQVKLFICTRLIKSTEWDLKEGDRIDQPILATSLEEAMKLAQEFEGSHIPNNQIISVEEFPEEFPFTTISTVEKKINKLNRQIERTNKIVAAQAGQWARKQQGFIDMNTPLGMAAVK